MSSDSDPATIATGFVAINGGCVAMPTAVVAAATAATSVAAAAERTARTVPAAPADRAADGAQKRERRRPLEARRSERSGDILRPTREGATGLTAAEVGVKERRLELGELAVDAQGGPAAGALAQG